MKIEIWSDLICPWCGLGQHRLEQALASFGHGEHVEIVHRSFQLDPSSPAKARPAREMLREKHGMTEEQHKAVAGRIEAMAASEGLAPYIVGDNLVGNTRLAHELLAMASEHGLEDEAWKHLYRAYFGERRSIFDIDSLVELGAEIGLNADEVRAALSEGRFRARVEADGAEAHQLGASGVPFVVVDRRYAVAGAQPAETFQKVLEQAWQEQPRPVLAAEDAEVCGPDGCAVPSSK